MNGSRDRSRDTSRRSLLIGAGVLAAGYAGLRYGIPQLSEVFAADFAFVAMNAPAGFRRIDGGESTAGFDPFFGMAGAVTAQAEIVASEVRTKLCDTLFVDPAPPDGVVPVASFSDYNCSFCRVLTERLADIQSSSPPRIEVAWHELPLLGEGSILAAKGALAAKRQGAYVAFHRRLMKSRFQATPAYLTTLAEDLGVDEAHLIRDMQGEGVATEIADPVPWPGYSAS